MGRQGHCLCGGVRYEIAGAPGVVVACHCSFCRRAHGAAFVPVTVVKRADLRWLAGEELLRIWETPGGGHRVFCRECGTRICNYPRVAPDMLSLVVETLDEPIEQEPVLHINVESKAPWYRILDGNPQTEGLPKRSGGAGGTPNASP